MIDEKTRAKRNEMVESNTGLVHACAKRFKGRGIEYDDLYQAGCVGLIKAADKFEPERGFSFSTYAVPVILGEIKRLFRDGSSIRIGRSIKEKSRLAVKEKENLSAVLGREPTISELSKALCMEPAETALLINASMPVVSLTSGEEGENQTDIPVGSHEESISDKLALYQVLETLDEKDRRMIELRYFKCLTQSKVAECLGMTQVQVSRREKAILEIIRKKLSA